MGLIEASYFQIGERPELVIGLTAAVGSPLTHVERVLAEALATRSYNVRSIRFSSLIEALDEAGNEATPGPGEYDRIRHLMRRGNALRERLGGGDALALLAAAEIASSRPDDDDLPVLDGQAFVMRQLKHPEEVKALRLIYGDRFHLIGIYAPEIVRCNWLRVTHGMSEIEARDLIETDEGEPGQFGQQLRETFHLADVFISLPDPSDTTKAEDQIKRYLSLVFSDHADGLITPTREEFGMFMAFNASLRSADLSRQVGAAILGPGGDVLSLGCNEVPAPGGGQYWPDDSHDARDFTRDGDSNALRKPELLTELLEVVDPEFRSLEKEQREERVKVLVSDLGPARMMNLTEFGRPVHAEMEALLAAGRVGVSTRNVELYTTTFPCHNCAKHIVAAGVNRVVYVEPYPKSLAIDLHGDAIRLADEDSKSDHRVDFESFVGVSPRRFTLLFSMVLPNGTKVRRKDGGGRFLRATHGLRTVETPLNYMDREAVAAHELREFVSSEQQEFSFDEEDH